MSFRRLFSSRVGRVAPKRLDRLALPRIGFESLEDRTTPAIFTATIDPAADSSGANAQLIGLFNKAASNSQPDTINLFPGGTYSFAGPNNTSGNGSNALPLITVDGTGKNAITVNGNAATLSRATGATDFRFFELTGSPNSIALTINDLTFLGGSAKGSGAAQDGGAIYVSSGGALTVNNSVFNANTADGSGGAVRFNGTSGEISNGVFTNTKFTSNVAQADGGAVANSFGAFLQFNSSNISNNKAVGGTGGVGTFTGTFEFNDTVLDSNVGMGLGSSGAFNGSEATFTRSTITNNVATSGGTGGVSSGSGNIRVVESFVANNDGQFTVSSGGGVQGSKVEVINSTVTNNKSGGGGGIAGTDVIVQHSTVTLNQATFGIASAGGIQAKTLNITHSIVAQNTNTSAISDISDFSVSGGATVSKGFNFFGVVPLTNFTAVASDFGGTKNAPINPFLSSTAQLNGGSTPTLAPLVFSPVINAGSTTPSTGLTTDQRGLARVVGSKADIGAFEVQAGNALSVVQGNGQAAGVSLPFGTTLRVLVTDPNGNAVSGAAVTFQAPNTPSPTASAGLNGGGTSAVVVTKAAGTSTVSAVANDQAGSYKVIVSVPSGAGTVFLTLQNTNFGGTGALVGTPSVSAGNNQTAVVGVAYVNPIVLSLTNSGNPVAGVPFLFTAPSTGASATFAGGVTSQTFVTDSAGSISLPITANSKTGPFQIVASNATLGTVAFSLNNTPGVASIVSIISGNGQFAIANKLYTAPLRVQVTDSFGNPIGAGNNVTFTAPAAGASVAFAAANPVTVQTLADGTAQTVIPTANNLGGTVAISAALVSGTPGIFNLTNVAVPPPPPPPPAPNTAPQISDVLDTTAINGSPTAALPLFITDFETGASSLTLTASSTNTALTPVFTFGGSGSNRTVTVNTASGLVGTATITVVVSDGTLTATDTFDVTVNPVPPPPPPPPGANIPPSISDVNSLTIQAGQSTSAIPFLVLDTETPAANLVVTATSSNPTLTPTVTLGGTGSNRNIAVTTATGTFGTATITLLVTDAAGGTATDTFVVTVPDSSTIPPPPPPPPPPAAPVRLIGTQQFAVTSDAGGPQVVRLYNADQSERLLASAFPGTTGGVRNATGDFNGDGIADIVIGTGPGVATQVKILNGVTNAELFSFQPFEAAFTGGVYVAAGDVNGDGTPDLIVTPDQGGGPRVKLLSGKGFGQLADFFGIDDPNFRGGARAAIGDVNGDGVSDVVVAAGFGGGPRVAGYDGISLGNGSPVKIFADFFVFEQSLRNGVFLTLGDINGDGFSEVIVGGGPGGGPRILAINGSNLLNNVITTDADFFADNVDNRSGVRIAVKDLDGDKRADLVVGSGEGAGSRVTGYLGRNIPAAGTPSGAFSYDAFPGFTGGIFVG